MGEAKRRQVILGKQYDRGARQLFTKPAKEKLIKWTIEGLIISLFTSVVLLITLRF